MPELPEVETTKRGIEGTLTNQQITGVWTSGLSLRYPVSPTLNQVIGLQIKAVSRRAKYLLIQLSDDSHLLYHLGMSGMMRLSQQPHQTIKHDHVVLTIEGGVSLVFHDPRRFGCVLHVEGDINQHRLIKKLGPEPFDDGFTAEYLKQQANGKKTPVKSFIMNNDVVVGVGNIYASEALFLAGIHPHRAADRVSLKRYQLLQAAVVKVLSEAIQAGGTTLKDFHQSDGKPGYFQQKLMVYGRSGENCFQCQTAIKKVKTGQRSSYYCPHCQK